MSTTRTIAIGLAASIAAWAAADATELDVTGHVGVSGRSFWQDRQFTGQDGGSSSSFKAQTEFYWRALQGRSRLSLVAFGRIDSADDERSHADLREAYFGFDGNGWDLNVGVNKVFWGVTESRHLVDVINQTDLVEDIDGEDKLGQPMLNVNLQRDFGRFELYYLPRFRERTFPGSDGRFRPAVPVADDVAIYEAGEGSGHDDIALRYSHYFGDVDVGAYFFNGTSREPRFVIAPDGYRLFPVYEQMTQAGIDVQYTRDSWLLKLEAIRRDAISDSFNAAVAGFEYTFFGARGSTADVGVLFEYLYDDRGPAAPPTPFDDDIFVGARLALNDASDTSVLAGTVVDVDTHEVFFNVEAERRFGDSLTLDLRLRLFGNAEPGDALASFERDDYVELTLAWYY